MKLLENNRSAGYDSIDRARSTLTDIRYILGEDLPVSSDLCDVPFPLEIPVLESVTALLDALNQLSETQSLTPGDHPSSLSHPDLHRTIEAECHRLHALVRSSTPPHPQTTTALTTPPLSNPRALLRQPHFWRTLASLFWGKNAFFMTFPMLQRRLVRLFLLLHC